MLHQPRHRRRALRRLGISQSTECLPRRQRHHKLFPASIMDAPVPQSPQHTRSTTISIKIHSRPTKIQVWEAYVVRHPLEACRRSRNKQCHFRCRQSVRWLQCTRLASSTSRTLLNRAIFADVLALSLTVADHWIYQGSLRPDSAAWECPATASHSIYLYHTHRHSRISHIVSSALIAFSPASVVSCYSFLHRL